LSGIEKVHTDFVKRILKVKQSTPSVMLYSDLVRVPLSINIKKRVIGYWYVIINGDNNQKWQSDVNILQANGFIIECIKLIISLRNILILWMLNS